MNTKKRYRKVVLGLFVGLLFFGCDPLDKKNLSQINPDDVWSDIGLARSVLTDIYAENMPGPVIWSGGQTLETFNRGKVSGLSNGEATVPKSGRWSYAAIRRINEFLADLAASSFEDKEKKLMNGQALFFRAWQYYGLVRLYGGVPLITKVLGREDELFLPRSRTSEVITQIVADLDAAIADLPPTWTGDDIGRIDGCAARVLKTQVLILWASPQFNDQPNEAKWTKAYEAAKAAKEFCEANGKGLHEKFSEIWTTENNKEVIMVKKYKRPSNTYSQAAVRPLLYANGATGAGQCSLSFVDLFPMKDGTPFDSTISGYDTFHLSRDPRLYATVAYNGSKPYLKDMVNDGTNMWTYYVNDTIGYPVDQQEGEQNYAAAGFYRVKGLDPEISEERQAEADLDAVSIRFAEVLLDYAETANEIGKSNEALEVLKKIRIRAGILPGATGNYGITAATQENIREAIYKERMIELAFEGKLFNTMRRLSRFKDLNDLGQRYGLKITLKPNKINYAVTSPLADITNPEVYQSFSYETFKGDLGGFNYPVTKMRFDPIPQDVLDANSKLKQNNNWEGGTFDPKL